MGTIRIALANLRFPGSREESVELAVEAVGQAGRERAELVCFPECYVPGYRGPGRKVAPPDASFLERAWEEIAAAARRARVGVILGTERVEGTALFASALVINADGGVAGFQDKVQLDTSEEGTYSF